MISNVADGLGDAIARGLTRDGPILIGDRAAQIKDERIPSFVVIEHDRFDASRRDLFKRESGLRTLQFLFVTKTSRAEVFSFARDLWSVDYRDVAFLLFDDGGNGTILRANVTENGITLKSVGSCGRFANDVDRIPAFAADARRFCPRGGCSVKYGMVADDTVRFWRKEDTLKLKREQSWGLVCACLCGDVGFRLCGISPFRGVRSRESRIFEWRIGGGSIVGGVYHFVGVASSVNEM